MSEYRVKLISGPSPKRYSGLTRVLQPLRYYKLDETSGTVAVDAMGVANGTYFNTPTLNQNPLITQGKSIYLDGTNRYMIGGVTGITTDITLNIWFTWEPGTQAQSYLWYIPQGVNVLTGYITTASGVLKFFTSDASTSSELVGPALSQGKTYFASFIRTGNKRQIWLNGELVAQDQSSIWVTPSTSLVIGHPTSGYSWKGFVDEVSIFNKEIQPIYIKELYEEGLLTPLKDIAELVNARVTSVEYEPFSQGVARITLPTTDLGVQGIKTKGRREVQVWRNNHKIAEGPIWTIWGDSKNSFINVEPLPSYFAKRHIETTKEYTATDINTILWDLIDDTQTEKGTLGITAANFLPVGITRDAKYPSDEHANIGDALLDFPEVEWAIEIYDDGRREWTPYYPGRGSIRVSDKLEWGGFVVDYRYSYHAIESATSVIFNGKGTGPDKPEGSYHDPALSDLNVYLSKIRTDQNVIDPAILNTMAEQLVKKIGIDEVVPDLKIANNPHEPDYDFVGSILVGDVFPVYLVHDDRVLVDGLFRVVKAVLDPEEDSMWLTIEEYDV